MDDNVDAAESVGMLLRLAGHDVRLAYKEQVIGAEVEHRGEENLRAGAEAPAPIGSAVEGLPGGLLHPGYRHSAAHDRSRRSYSAGDVEGFFGFAEAVAAEQEDLRVFDEPIDDGGGDGRVEENVAPVRERSIGGDQCRTPVAVARGNDLVKQVRRLLVQGQIPNSSIIRSAGSV